VTRRSWSRTGRDGGEESALGPRDGTQATNDSDVQADIVRASGCGSARVPLA